jgi:hypothetical protein
MESLPLNQISDRLQELTWKANPEYQGKVDRTN